MVLMDNCTGQNKSKVVLQFFGLLSLLYKRVTLFYFVKGHTKMICDRVVALQRLAIKRHNLYTLEEIVEKIDGTKSIYPEIIRNGYSSSPCRSGWGRVLSKYIRKMPPGYTKNHIFSIEDGVVSFKHIASTSESAACLFRIFDDVEQTRKKVFRSLFGHSNIDKLDFHQLVLPVTPLRTLSEKKLLSLGRKFPTIPAKYLPTYPSLTSDVEEILAKEAEAQDDLERVKKSIVRKRKRKSSIKKSREQELVKNQKRARVGRPRKQKPANSKISQEDLLRFFRLQ